MDLSMYWLSFTIKEVQRFLPIWLLGSNPKKIKHGYIFMKGFAPTSRWEIHCCMFLMLLFRVVAWTAASRVCVDEKESTFWSREMSEPSFHVIRSTWVSSTLLCAISELCWDFICLLNYSALYCNSTGLYFSHESGLKGLCCHTAVHGPISCAGTTPSWKSGWCKITLPNGTKLWLRRGLLSCLCH